MQRWVWRCRELGLHDGAVTGQSSSLGQVGTLWRRSQQRLDRRRHLGLVQARDGRDFGQRVTELILLNRTRAAIERLTDCGAAVDHKAAALWPFSACLGPGRIGPDP